MSYDHYVHRETVKMTPRWDSGSRKDASHAAIFPPFHSAVRGAQNKQNNPYDLQKGISHVQNEQKTKARIVIFPERAKSRHIQRPVPEVHPSLQAKLPGCDPGMCTVSVQAGEGRY